jgi:diguanylate cyclase (GGDEF)-like protein
LAEEVREALDEHQSLSVFLFDIDNFKHYNDSNGHVAGDQLLRELARLVQGNVRRDSLFGRFGGEEFILFLPKTSKEQALAAAENVRRLIAEHSFANGSDQPLGCLSISGGVATCPEDATESAVLLNAADEALYAAKHAGRNRVQRYVPQYLGDQTQEPVEPAEIPDQPEDGDDAEATGPVEPGLLPASAPARGMPAPGALLPRGGEAPQPIEPVRTPDELEDDAEATGPVDPPNRPETVGGPGLRSRVLPSGRKVWLHGAAPDDLVVVDDDVDDREPADELSPDQPRTPRTGEARDHLTFGPAWIEPG